MHVNKHVNSREKKQNKTDLLAVWKFPVNRTFSNTTMPEASERTAGSGKETYFFSMPICKLYANHALLAPPLRPLPLNAKTVTER